MVPQPIALAAD